MKIAYTLILQLFFANFIFSQSWDQLTSVPGSGREAPFAFSLNGKIYLGGGVNNGAGINNFYMYEPATNSWVAKANLPDFIWGPAYFSINGKGYVVSGENNSSLVTSVFEYDPILDQWNAKANFPGAARENTFGFAIGDTGYIFGGFPGGSGHSELNDLWAYNPVNDTWTQKAPMPSSGRSGPGGFVLNNIAYVGLGEYSSAANYPSDIFAYSPSTNTWSPIAQYPGHVGNGPLGYTVGGKGYLGLANYLDPNTSTVDFYHAIYEYDPFNNTWMASDSFNGPGRSNAVCQQVGDTVYIGSGQGPIGGLIDWWRNTSFVTDIISITENEVRVYPNPFTEKFLIDLGANEKNVEISVSNILGQNIFRKNILNAGNSITINRSDLNDAGGVLFLSVSSNNATKTFKLVANQ